MIITLWRSHKRYPQSGHIYTEISEEWVFSIVIIAIDFCFPLYNNKLFCRNWLAASKINMYSSAISPWQTGSVGH